MATAHGTFILHDRASRTLDRLQRKAEQTDSTFKRLALTMDSVGDRGQVRQLDQYNRSMENLSRTNTIMTRDNDRVSKSFRAAGREAETFGMRLRKLGANLISVQKIIGLLKLPAFAALIGAAGQGISALAGSIVTLLPKLADLWGLVAPLPATFLALGGAMITAKLAFADLGKAMSGNKEAMKDLTPEAKRLVTTLKLYQPVIKELRQSAQRGLFPGVEFAIRRLQKGVPAAQQALGMFGRALGGIASAGATRFTAGTFLRDFVQLASHASSILARLGGAVFNIIEGLMDFAIAARPFTNWLVDTVVGWTRFWKETMRAGRESGALREKLERTKEALITFGHILKNLWGIFKAVGQASRRVGDDLWQDAERATKAWERFASSPAGQIRLRRDFQIMARNLHAVNRLIGAIAKALYRMGTRPEFAQMIDSLTRAVPSIERFLNIATKTFGPVLMDILGEIVRLLERIIGTTGPLNVMLTLLADVLRFFNNLLDRSRTLSRVFTTLFQVVMIAKFTGWAIKLAQAFLGIQTSATAIAASGVMGGGRGGGRFAATGPGVRGRLGGIAGGIGGFFGIGGRGRGGARGKTPFGFNTERTTASQPGRLARLGGIGGRWGGPALAAAGVGAMFSPWEKLQNIGMMTATGAMIGSVFPGPGTAIGAGIGAAAGLGMAAFGGGGPGLDEALVGPGSKYGKQAAWLSRPARTPAMAARQESGLRTLRGTDFGSQNNSAVIREWRRSLSAEINARHSYLSDLKRAQDEETQGKGVRMAGRLAAGYGRESKMWAGKGMSQTEIAKLIRGQLLRDLQLPGLGAAGKKKLSEIVLKSMLQIEKGGAGGKGFKDQVDITMKAVETRFGKSKTTIDRHTGEIKKSSIRNFEELRMRISTDAERANTNVSASFARMKATAVAMLQDMGYNLGAAQGLVAAAAAGQTGPAAGGPPRGAINQRPRDGTGTVGAATGGIIQNVPGGVYRVAEAGHPEAVVPLDPKHRSRAWQVMGEAAKALGKSAWQGDRVPGFAAGGIANAGAIINAARSQIGVPYVWGGTSPGRGLDCSGLTQYAYGQGGVSIPRVTYTQYAASQHVPLGQLQPADLVFSGFGASGPGHVRLYIGNGQVIAAPHTGTNVQVQSLMDRSGQVGGHFAGVGGGVGGFGAFGQIAAPGIGVGGAAGAMGQLAINQMAAALSANLGKITWMGSGGTVYANRPSLIGVGESGPETVSVTRGRGGGGGGVTVHIGKIENNRDGDIRLILKREIEQAFNELATEIDVLPQVG